MLIEPKVNMDACVIPANPFQEDIYKSCWFEHLAEFYEVKAQYGDFTLHHQRFAKGLLGFRELRLYATQTAWFQDLTEERVHAFASLSQEIPWDSFMMNWADSRKDIQAVEQLKQLGYPMMAAWNTPMHMIDLRNGFDGYLASRNAKERYNIRQKLSHAHRCELVRYDRFEDIEPFFERAFELHIPYWRHKIGYSFFEVPEKRAFAVAWAKEMYATGRLRLHGLKIDGELVNLSSSFLHDHTMYWGLTINTGEKLDVYPGLVSLFLRMQEAVAEGATLFNMQYGAMAFKVQMQTHADNRHVLIVTNPKTLTGRMAQVYYQHKYKTQPGEVIT